MMGEVDAPMDMGTLQVGTSRDTVDSRIGDAPASLEFK
jgi:hypothetical protein